MLNDIPHLKQWVQGLEQVNILKKSPPDKLVIYHHFNFPFPFSDRDSVVAIRYQLIDDDKLEIFAKSTQHHSAPDSPGIRSRLLKGNTTIKRIDNNHSLVTIESQVDMGGWIPRWLIDYLQKTYASQTIHRLRQQVKKDFVESYPNFKDHGFKRF